MRTFSTILGTLVGLVALAAGPVNADWIKIDQSGASLCTGSSSDPKSVCTIMPGLTSIIGSAEAQAVAGVIRGYVAPNNNVPANPPPPSLHSPWLQCDVGAPPTAGSAYNDGGGGGVMTVTGSGDVGSNNNNNALVTHIVYQPWTGPVDFITQVKNITGTLDWRQAGIIFTDTQCANTPPWVSGSVSVETGTNQIGAGFHLDGTVNGRSTSYVTGIPQPPPQWLRLTWDGTVATFYYGSSQTGPWTYADSETRAMSGTNYVGVFVASGSNVDPQLSTATFTEPTISVLAGSAGNITLTTASQTIQENQGTFTICANRAGGTSGAVSAQVSVTGGSATGGGVDYTSSGFPYTLSFANGSSAQQCTPGIAVSNRAGTQGSRTINVALGTYTGGASSGSIPSQTITIQDSGTVTGTPKKFHAGYYGQSPRANLYKFTQANRFTVYDGEGSNTHLQGWNYLTTWSQLENATHGDYSNGDALLTAEMAHLKGEPVPKRLILEVDDENYGGSLSWYPTYVVNAGCVFDELWSDGVHHLFHFKWWNATCAGYYAQLFTHLGTLLDNDPYFEGITINYEEAMTSASVGGANGSTFDRTGFYNGFTTVMQAVASAFPHTNVSVRQNWGITFHETDLVQLLGIAKPLGIGWGSEDSCSIDPVTFQNVYGTYPIYQDAQNVFAGYGGYDSGHHAGTYTDQRGKMLSLVAVEDSELGYNSVCNGQGFAGYAPAASAARNAGYMDLYSEWNAEWVTHAVVEYNTWVGANVQRWSVGTTGSLWDLVTNHPLTHTACPTDYDTLFGNGTAGSGCNTN